MRISRRIAAIFLHDLLVTALAWGVAWCARFNFSIPPREYWQVALATLPLVLLVQGALNWRFGLYRGLWRFASLPDLWNIIRAALLGALCLTLALFVWNRLEGVPRSLLILYPVFLVLFLGGPRLAYRLWKDHSLTLGSLRPGRRVLIVGAGRAGETVVRDMLRDPSFVPVGLLDDRRGLQGAHIHGVPVLGTIDRLPEVAEEEQAEMIFIAIPSAGSREMQRIVGLCMQSGLPYRTLPRLEDMGEVSIEALRNVSIEDLLGRDRVELDWRVIRAGISGRRVLVSGGGGSIGAELCRQVARLEPSRLVVVELSEFALFEIERELRRDFPDLELVTLLGDVTDEVAMERVFLSHQPQVVFHAAAYKHVPILEHQEREAVRNNVLGTRVLAGAADRHGCERFVLVSTDKAVNPSSVMGASKRVAEVLCQALNAGSATRFVTVRFGNVLGSAGSVVPLFREQIRNGGPVTVTHPEMTRYFMTIPEASQLILQAGVMGEGGEIFVLRMGEPVRILDLAEQMIRLAGKEPGRDIGIVYTGIREGEKLHEELFHGEERPEPTAHGKILRASHRPAQWSQVAVQLEVMATACRSFDREALRAALTALVPELGGTTAAGGDNIVDLQRRKQ
ncbi:MAG: polysaccharide biosynthesis protein [Gammaproteobacteria bacterium]|nr:MAG: polysaccharide biosynthesis protein [Gammaproteobacteria bacterium]